MSDVRTKIYDLINRLIILDEADLYQKVVFPIEQLIQEERVKAKEEVLNNLSGAECFDHNGHNGEYYYHLSTEEYRKLKQSRAK